MSERPVHISFLSVLSGLLLLFSLLTVFKAPVRVLWIPALLVTEWGHFFAIASLLTAVMTWFSSNEPGRVTLGAVIAALFYLSPLVRAQAVASALPESMTHAFGPAEIGQPFSWGVLMGGRDIPKGVVQELIYTPASREPLKLDFYSSGVKSASPLVVVIHGGSWQSGGKSEFPALSYYLATQGYAVASLDYRLAPQYQFPAQRDDVIEAIHYLKKNSVQLGIDPTRIILLGRSAGGQIALSTAYASHEPGIVGVISVYAPNDLVLGFENPGNPLMIDSRKLISAYIGGTPDTNPKGYAAASPLNDVGPLSPPTLMIHGLRDELVWPLHDERLSAKLKAAGRPHFFLELPWATHGCDINLSGPAGQLSVYAIERFLTAVSSRSPS